jgi:hypothetical protein
MKSTSKIPVCFFFAALAFAASARAFAQDDPAPDPRRDFRYSLSAIDDATFYSGLQVPLPRVLNQFLVEPTLTFRYKPESRREKSTSLPAVAWSAGALATRSPRPAFWIRRAWPPIPPTG